jgi:hypothetical protein
MVVQTSMFGEEPSVIIRKELLKKLSIRNGELTQDPGAWLGR